MTTTFKRPGTYVEEVSLPQQIASLGTATSLGAFVGASALGPTTATYVASWPDFVRRYGSFDVTKSLHFAVYQFFSNGGRGAVISRVVGAGAGTATVTLTDRAGTPLSTLQVNAISPGAWANSSTAVTGLYVEVVDNGSTDTFDLVVYQGGSTAQYMVERWNSVSMSSTSSRYVVQVINPYSLYIQVVNLNSATAAPNNRPAAAGAKTLTSGADGSAPVQANYTAALTQGNAACALDSIPNSLVLNIPDIAGMNDTDAIAVLQAAETYAIARGDVFVVGDVPSDVTTAAGALSFASSVYNSGSQSGANIALYFPYIYVSDPIVPGASRTLPPGGAVAGLYMATDATDGVFRAPAGLKTTLKGVVAPALSLTSTDLDNLNSGNPPVNAIRSIPGAGICVMGARTLDPGNQSKYIPIRRSVIYIKKTLTDATAFSVFEPNDERLWERLRTICSVALTQFWQAGGLRGLNSTDAFYVKCDSTTISPADINAGIVRIQVGVALQSPAEYILISIGQFQGGVSVSNS